MYFLVTVGARVEELVEEREGEDEGLFNGAREGAGEWAREGDAVGEEVTRVLAITFPFNKFYHVQTPPRGCSHRRQLELRA